jgi:hypothetical protein
MASDSSYIGDTKPKSHYAAKSFSVLTPEEQVLYINDPKKMVGVYVSAADAEYLQANNINLSRIVYFLVHEWLAKKREAWGE